jgi:hypothetical protein
MEHFFTPARRLHDRLDCSDEEPLGYTEVQLAVSIKSFMNHSWDWSDLYAFVKGDEGEMWKILWITDEKFIFVEDENNLMDFDIQNEYEIHQRAMFTTKSGETHELILAIDQNATQ